MLTRRLHALVAAVCPIAGVSVGDPANKATWTFDPLPGATAQQLADAQAVIDALDTSPEAQAAWEEDQKPERRDLRQLAAQAVQNNNDFLDVASPTAAQVRDQVRALTQQMNRVIRRLIQVD